VRKRYEPPRSPFKPWEPFMSNPDDFEVNPYAAPKAELVFEDIAPIGAFQGYAGFWQRFVAYFIDGIVVGIVGFAINLATQGVIQFGLANGRNDPSLAFLILGINWTESLALQVAYFATMESSASQATLGKMAMGIKVTNLYGQRITFWNAVGRYLGKIISSLICNIGYIMAAFTERKQALHDQIAGTLVVKTR
jgi:uncharacterized RDD family membrane protein YckC